MQVFNVTASGAYVPQDSERLIFGPNSWPAGLSALYYRGLFMRQAHVCGNVYWNRDLIRL